MFRLSWLGVGLRSVGLSVVAGACALSTANAATRVSGQVLDLNGQPLPQAQVTIEKPANTPGATAVTVFTDEAGRFAFPEPFGDASGGFPVKARALGFEQIRVSQAAGADTGSASLTVLMRGVANQASAAPASAYLRAIADPDLKAKLIQKCIGCHQVPSPEARAYANAIHDLNGGAADARAESWRAMVKYMNFLSAEEFGRGNPDAPTPEASRVYSVGSGDEIAAILSQHFTGRLAAVQGYAYGAPLIVNAKTVIKEYEVPRPNAIREALMIGSPPKLYAADVSANRLVRIDVATGAQDDLEVPTERIMGPHTLVKGKDDSLWVGSFFNGYVAELDTKTEKWRTWRLVTKTGVEAGIHDPTFDSRHELVADKRGRIWFSDIVNNAVGYYHPKTGETGIFPAPEVEGRPGKGAQLYGFAISSDRKRVWYTQFGIGAFGCFNVETLKFETLVRLPLAEAGPRRITMSDDDVLYVPLYGSGQLIEYDAKAGKQIGIYDLPDRASAPYAVTWDPLRKVVWIPTSNADVIYRFDPRTKTFGVLPLPRERAFLRMVQVERKTGMLVTSYANIVEAVHGPRMAVVIDLGDGVTEASAATPARSTQARN